MIGDTPPEPAARWSPLLAALTGGIVAGVIFLIDSGLGGAFTDLLWHWAAGSVAFALVAGVRNHLVARS